MNKLPVELLDRIMKAAFPITGIRYKAEILPLSLVSRQWNLVATPLLFAVVTIDIAVRDKQVAAVKAADPSLRHVQTLLTLYTFLVTNPSLAAQITSLTVRTAIPHRMTGPYNLLDSSHGVDPQSLCAVLSAVPNIRRLNLYDIFLSRSPCGAASLAPPLTSLGFNFTMCSEHLISEGLEVLDIIKLFPSADILIVASVDAEGRHSYPSHTQAGGGAFPCSRLIIGDTIVPEYIYKFVAPPSPMLTTLSLTVAGRATLRWLTDVLPDIAMHLSHFALSILPSALPDTIGGDFSLFTFLSGHRWQDLREVHVNFNTPLRGDDPCRTWCALLHMMHALQPSAFPSLEQVILCGGGTAHDRLVALEQIPEVVRQRFERGQDNLLRLAKNAAFKLLTIVVFNPRDNSSATPEAPELGSTTSFEQLFALLRDQKLLSVRDLRNDTLLECMMRLMIGTAAHLQDHDFDVCLC